MARYNPRAARFGRGIDWPAMSYYSATPAACKAAYRVVLRRNWRAVTAKVYAAFQSLSSAFSAFKPPVIRSDFARTN